MDGDKHDLSYYIKCMIGGPGLTHTAIVPLNDIKCRRPVFPTLYKSLGDRLSTTFKTKVLAWGPTLIGYSLFGLGKFGFYEILKDVYKSVVGEENVNKYRRIGWPITSGSTEVIADTLLCPMEAIKVRMQTSKPLHSQQVEFMKVLMDSTKVWDPFVLDKFHTQQSSSLLLNKLFHYSMKMCSQNQRTHTLNSHNCR